MVAVQCLGGTPRVIVSFYVAVVKGGLDEQSFHGGKRNE